MSYRHRQCQYYLNQNNHNESQQGQMCLYRKNFDFYYISLTNIIGNKKVTKGWMACLAPDGKFCLFRKGTKVWIDGSVHPQYQIKGKKIKYIG